MDKQIRKIEKKVKEIKSTHGKKHSEKKMEKKISTVSRALKHLEKLDKKRDPACDLGKEIMKKKKKK
jgi:chaperonin cofactor prefoldin